MAYTDDAVLAKLSALNESHESIATAAQWIMFHRRMDNTLTTETEVTQQSKARHKEDFVLAFSPVIAEATASAYKGGSSDIQNKLRRVIDVWKDRNIFEQPIQEAIEARIEELDKAKGAPKSAFGGGSIFGSSSSSAFPSELSALVAPQQNVSKLLLPTKAAASSADQDYGKLFDPAAPVPSAPVYAARLNGLLKALASAEGAVAECVKARRTLIGALEKILDTNRAALEEDEARLADLVSRKATVDTKKQDIELAIMSGLASSSAGAGAGGDNDPASHKEGSGSPAPEPDRPEVEALTPPSAHDSPGDFYDNIMGTPPPAGPPADEDDEPAAAAAAAASSSIAMDGMLPTTTTTNSRSSLPPYQSVPVSTNGANKRRRLDSGSGGGGGDDDFPDLGGDDDGIDEDVAEMLRKDSSVGS
ncbi:uncharacterized protein E0L32_004672 [Thyridium curvatum]|uniref:CID domain-containing protein n=1 Tax=Thyridium curvatum TaxID=1093900 RepID=A0A507B921_9PEZI|nr:uncharacterized protein E0L32_004672 [Thyridium curvatum]TPX15114.1 hypothetical protein E0L32_004672 [Thyridium curvatum]